MIAKSLLRSSAIVAGALLLGRFSGLLREVTLGHALGFGFESDLAVLIILLPDLITSLLMGGAVSSVLVPELHRLERDSGRSAARHLVHHSLLLVFVFSLLGTLVLSFAASPSLSLVAPGFSADNLHRALPGFQAALWSLPAAMLTAITAAVLQAYDRPLLPALGNLFFNLVVMAGIVIAAWTSSFSGIVLAVVAASFVRFGSQIFACHRIGLVGWPSTSEKDDTAFSPPALRPAAMFSTLTVRYMQALAAMGTTVFLPIISRAFASHASGGIAAINYTSKLVEFPRGILSSLLAFVVLPRLSRHAMSRSNDDSATLALTLKGLCLIGLPMTLAMSGLGGVVVDLLVSNSRSGATSTSSVLPNLIRIGSWSVFPLLISQLWMQVFHAHQNTRDPWRISLVVVLLHLATSWQFHTAWGLTGLMSALVLVSWIQSVMLLAILIFRHSEQIVRLSWKRPLAAVLATLVIEMLATTIVPVRSSRGMALVVSTVTSAFDFAIIWVLFSSKDPVTLPAVAVDDLSVQMPRSADNLRDSASDLSQRKSAA